MGEIKFTELQDVNCFFTAYDIKKIGCKKTGGLPKSNTLKFALKTAKKSHKVKLKDAKSIKFFLEKTEVKQKSSLEKVHDIANSYKAKPYDEKNTTIGLQKTSKKCIKRFNVGSYVVSNVKQPDTLKVQVEKCYAFEKHQAKSNCPRNIPKNEDNDSNNFISSPTKQEENFFTKLEKALNSFKIPAKKVLTDNTPQASNHLAMQSQKSNWESNQHCKIPASTEAILYGDTSFHNAISASPETPTLNLSKNKWSQELYGGREQYSLETFNDRCKPPELCSSVEMPINEKNSLINQKHLSPGFSVKDNVLGHAITNEHIVSESGSSKVNSSKVSHTLKNLDRTKCCYIIDSNCSSMANKVEPLDCTEDVISLQNKEKTYTFSEKTTEEASHLVEEALSKENSVFLTPDNFMNQPNLMLLDSQEVTSFFNTHDTEATACSNSSADNLKFLDEVLNASGQENLASQSSVYMVPFDEKTTGCSKELCEALNSVQKILNSKVSTDSGDSYENLEKSSNLKFDFASCNAGMIDFSNLNGCNCLNSDKTTPLSQKGLNDSSLAMQIPLLKPQEIDKNTLLFEELSVEKTDKSKKQMDALETIEAILKEDGESDKEQTLENFFNTSELQHDDCNNLHHTYIPNNIEKEYSDNIKQSTFSSHKTIFIENSDMKLQEEIAKHPLELKLVDIKSICNSSGNVEPIVWSESIKPQYGEAVLYDIILENSTNISQHGITNFSKMLQPCQAIYNNGYKPNEEKPLDYYFVNDASLDYNERDECFNRSLLNYVEKDKFDENLAEDTDIDHEVISGEADLYKTPGDNAGLRIDSLEISTDRMLLPKVNSHDVFEAYELQVNESDKFITLDTSVQSPKLKDIDYNQPTMMQDVEKDDLNEDTFCFSKTISENILSTNSQLQNHFLTATEPVFCSKSLNEELIFDISSECTPKSSTNMTQLLLRNPEFDDPKLNEHLLPTDEVHTEKENLCNNSCTSPFSYLQNVSDPPLCIDSPSENCEDTQELKIVPLHSFSRLHSDMNSHSYKNNLSSEANSKKKTMEKSVCVEQTVLINSEDVPQHLQSGDVDQEISQNLNRRSDSQNVVNNEDTLIKEILNCSTKIPYVMLYRLEDVDTSFAPILERKRRLSTTLQNSSNQDEAAKSYLKERPNHKHSSSKKLNCSFTLKKTVCLRKSHEISKSVEAYTNEKIPVIKIWKKNECNKMVSKSKCTSAPLLCSICNEAFHETLALERHKKTHGIGNSYKRDFRFSTFQNKKYVHCCKRLHSSKKPFKCSLCSKSFAKSDAFAAHNKIHSRKKTFLRSLFKQSFTREIVNHHKKARLNTGRYKCDLCCKPFAKKSNLIEHMQIHPIEKVHAPCNMTFYEKENLTSHLSAPSKKSSTSDEYDFCDEACLQ